MTNIEIQEVLETAYEKTFLDSIEYLYSKEKEYKGSSFFKTTRIPLTVLYEKYYTYMTSQVSMLEKITELINSFDMEIVYKKVEEFLVWLKENDKINEIFKDIIENFDPSILDKYSEEIKGLVEKFKEE